jgi:hypothetical protein
MDEFVAANSAARVGEIAWKVTEQEDEVFFARVTLYDASGEQRCENLYMFSQKNETIFSPLSGMAGGKLDVQGTGDGFLIRNDGSKVCLFVCGIDVDMESVLLLDTNYITLFPGEARSVKVIERKAGSGFRKESFVWDYFNRIA